MGARRVRLVHPLTTGERELVSDNLRLVHHAIKRHYWAYTQDYDDLVSAGALGLMAAAQCYQPERARFSTHAIWYIRGYISNHLRQQRRRDPCLSLDGCYTKHREEPGDPLGASLPVVSTELEDVLCSRDIDHLLPSNQQAVVRLVWLGYTQAEIARALRCSQPQVSRLWQRARATLQDAWGTPDP